MGYMGNFIVYFFAMIGIIILALYVYKKFNVSSMGFKRNNSLKVEDTLTLTPRKTLYVIRNGNERFLIAGDMERTTLISKLADSQEAQIEEPKVCQMSSRRYHTADLSDENIRRQDSTPPSQKRVMKEIRTKLNF